MKNGIVGLVTFALATACVTTRLNRRPAGQYDDLTSASLQQVGPSFSDLTKIINLERPASVEQFLAIWSQKFPEHMSRYALMYESFSLQNASFENPRAIVFGQNAKLVFSFNGRSDQEGYSAIEVMSYNDSTKAFQFNEIDFADPQSLRSSFKTSDDKCLACHGAIPKPIWDSYSLWPGAYGSDDDSVHGEAIRADLKFKNGGMIEENELNEFNRKKFEHARYRYLPAQDNQTPNADLSYLLSRLNSQRIAKLLKLSPSKAKDFLRVINCSDPSSYGAARTPEEPAPIGPDARQIYLKMLEYTANKVRRIETARGDELMMSEPDKFWAKQNTAWRDSTPDDKYLTIAARFSSGAGPRQANALAFTKRSFNLDFDDLDLPIAIESYGFNNSLGDTWNDLAEQLTVPIANQYLRNDFAVKTLIAKIEQDTGNSEAVRADRKQLCRILGAPIN